MAPVAVAALNPQESKGSVSGDPFYGYAMLGGSSHLECSHGWGGGSLQTLTKTIVFAGQNHSICFFDFYRVCLNPSVSNLMSIVVPLRLPTPSGLPCCVCTCVFVASS